MVAVPKTVAEAIALIRDHANQGREIISAVNDVMSIIKTDEEADDLHAALAEAQEVSDALHSSLQTQLAAAARLG